MAATAGNRLTLDTIGKCSKCLLLRNYKYDLKKSQTVHECSLDGLLEIIGFLFQYEIQNGGYGRT